MLKQKNDGCNRDLASQGGYETTVRREHAYMAESSRNCLHNLDWVLARLALAVTAVQPGSDRENDDDKGVS